MPYRFKINEPVEKGFRRIALEQLDSSLAELAGPQIIGKNVHECRKSLKRLRSLVRLASDAIGHGKARRRTKALGDIAQLLSARRDQIVMLETIDKLSNENSGAAETLRPLKESLHARMPNGPETLDAEIAEQARQLLLREAKKFAHTTFNKRGFAALAGGLEASYRDGRKVAKYAYDEPTDENFHDVRKAVQWHWRQMSLLSKAWPDEFAVRVHASRELSQIFGDDHDLAVLVGAASSSDAMTEEQKNEAIAFFRAQQKMLRATAEYRVKRLFAEKPEAFVSRVATYWRCSRSLDPRLEVQAAPRQVGAADKAEAVAVEVPTPAPTEKRQASKPRLATKSDGPTASQRRA